MGGGKNADKSDEPGWNMLQAHKNGFSTFDIGPNEQVIDRSQAILEGETVENCLKRAATLLALSKDKLDYVILEQGVKGVLGTINLPYRVRVFRKGAVATAAQMVAEMAAGTGAAAAAAALAESGATGRIQAARAKVEVSGDRLTATLTIFPPKNGGAEITNEPVMAALAQARLEYGIDHSALKQMVGTRAYDQPTVIARGVPPQPSADGKIEFKINLEHKAAPKIEGRSQHADFHEINLIENVTAGQILAVVSPPRPGVPGQDIYGRPLAVKEPKGTVLAAGRNVAVSADGTTYTAGVDGQVRYAGGALSVEPVFEVAGNVDYHTGNISFLGTVVVRGNVEDQFVIRAAHDIVVHGCVGQACLEADGNIQVQGGILGKDGACLKAGKNLYAKFVENATIAAGRHVVVGEAIMHSRADAGGAIVLTGKKALLVGGLARAGQGIYARALGSEMGTKTALEVGLQLHLRDRLRGIETDAGKERLALQKVTLGLRALLKMRMATGTLPPEKETMFRELNELAQRLKVKVERLNAETEQIRDELARASVTGKVGIQGKVHPGVSVNIGSATLQIVEPVEFVTFFYEAGEVRQTPYEAPHLKKLLKDENDPDPEEKSNGRGKPPHGPAAGSGPRAASGGK